MDKSFGIYFVTEFNGKRDYRFERAKNKAEAERKLKYIKSDLSVQSCELVEF